jgi:dihydrofolate reductase
MRKIVAGEFISLDGVVEAPNEWHFPYFNDEMGEAVGSDMTGADAMLLGRRTYEEFASVWPSRPSDEPGADFMNDTPKFVVSTTLKTVEWQNSTLINGDFVEEISRLKQMPGKNLNVVGSPTLVRSLLREGLLDELHLLMHPIVVGRGKRLFDNGIGQVPLELVESKIFSTGVLSLNYAPADR